jgi:putative transposase
MESKSHFVSLNVVGWIDVFTSKSYASTLMNALMRWTRNQGPELQAYVILSNCIHFIARETTPKLNEHISHFKEYTGKEMISLIHQNKEENRTAWLGHMLGYFGKYNKDNEHFQFWQCRNTCIALENQEQIRRKIGYLHNLPVNQGIVSAPEHYSFSSASPLNELKIPLSEPENLLYYIKN